jgi:hypothetical protein
LEELLVELSEELLVELLEELLVELLDELEQYVLLDGKEERR